MGGPVSLPSSLSIDRKSTRLNSSHRFLSSLSSDSNGDNEGADIDDEEISELDDLQAPKPLKVKSYSEACSELNHVSDFFTAQGESNLADELCKIISKAQ